jgi:hypothetical protein
MRYYIPSNPSQTAFLDRFCSEAAKTGLNERLATDEPAPNIRSLRGRLFPGLKGERVNRL